MGHPKLFLSVGAAGSFLSQLAAGKLVARDDKGEGGFHGEWLPDSTRFSSPCVGRQAHDSSGRGDKGWSGEDLMCCYCEVAAVLSTGWTIAVRARLVGGGGRKSPGKCSSGRSAIATFIKSIHNGNAAWPPLSLSPSV